MMVLTDWLLAAETPSIPYFTYLWLLDRPHDDSEVRASREKMFTTGPIPEILAAQTPAGTWTDSNSFYTPKYTSTHWTMELLVELGVDPRHPGYVRGVEFMLNATAGSLCKDMEDDQHGWVCFWGNLLHYALTAGFIDDPRVQSLIQRCVKEVDSDWACEHNAELSCSWGAARALWGLAAIPADARTKDVQAAIAHGLDFLLARYSLLEADYPTPGDPHKMWQKLNFPLFYQVDVLFVLRVLAALKMLDRPEAAPALDWLAARRGKNGLWRGASPYRGRTWRNLGSPEETARWLSLQAAVVLKQAGRPWAV